MGVGNLIPTLEGGTQKAHRTTLGVTVREELNLNGRLRNVNVIFCNNKTTIGLHLYHPYSPMGWELFHFRVGTLPLPDE